MARWSRPDSLMSNGDWLWITRSILRPEIDDKHIVEHRADEFAEFLVGRVINVGIAVRIALEGEDESVGAPFVAALLAHVGPAFIVLDLTDLPFQIAEGVFDLFDLLVGRRWFEFECHDVAQFACRSRGAVRGADG